MRYVDITNNINKTSKNESWIDIDVIGEELNLDLFNQSIDAERLKAYWIGQWYSTDEYVGFRMYFLDDIPVCFSVQEGRKTDEVFTWFSRENACRVREYLISLMKEKDDEVSVDVCDINSEAGDGYHIVFSENVLDWSKATLNGKPVQFIERIRDNPDYGIDTKIKIRDCNNEVLNVDVRDLLKIK